jgi:hypothetical protein
VAAPLLIVQIFTAMKSKNTFILLILAGAIYAFIHFYESKQPSSQQAAERAGKVVQFDRDKVTKISLKTSDSKIELEKKNGVWFMEKPVKDRADSMAINQLFTTAESLKSDSAIPTEKQVGGKDPLKEFGLGSPETRLAFTGGEKPIELLFGKDAAVEGKVYVRLEDSRVAHVISNDLKNQVSKKADDFRDHKLTDVVSTQVNKFTIKGAAGEIELEKKAQHWSLNKPFKARGNDQKVGDLIAQAANVHVESFVADSSNLATFGLQEPRGSVTLSTEGSKEPVVLQIGQPLEKDKEKIYVKLSTRDSVLVVPKGVEGLLGTKPNDVRDRNLLRVEADIVDRMTIEPKSGEKIVLARKGESWVRKVGDKDEPINVLAATRLLGELQTQQVQDFVADIATELPKYGLDQPAVKITLSSYASENTAETKAGEKPIVTVLLGRIEGDKVYAKLDDEPFVVDISRSFLDFALLDPLQWQDLTIYQNKADDIAALEISREGQPTVTLERDKDKKWTLVKGDGQVNQTNVQSLVNTLAGLRAVRWVGATTPEHGLAQPKMTILFKTASGAGKLLIGAETSDLLSYASAEGKAGTFGLSRPDVTAFQLPLIDAAPGVAAPPTEPTPVPAPTPAAPPAN